MPATVLGVGVFVCLLLGFYSVENWRGRRAWQRCQQELTAKGRGLEWAAYIPARVPDEQNSLKNPLLESLVYSDRVNSNLLGAMTEAWQPFSGTSYDFLAGQRVNWLACASLVRRRTNSNARVELLIEECLEVFRPLEAQFAELRRAGLRPLAQFDLERSDPFEEKPGMSFVAIRTLSRMLAFKACGEAGLGRHEEALAELRVVQRLADALRGETTLVTLMMSQALENLVLQAFWEGWMDRRWTEEELVEFQKWFGQVKLGKELVRVLGAERAGISRVLEKYGRSGELWRAMQGGNSGPSGWWHAVQQRGRKLIWKAYPQGWVYQNLALYNREMETLTPEGLGGEPAQVVPSQSDKDWAEFDKRQGARGPFFWLASMANPNVSKATTVTARNQTWLSEARTVCALERYRRGHGSYPETLAALVPEYLEKEPVDMIGGKPLRYKPTGDGKFLLYSVGWNEKDDGGVTAKQKANPANLDFRQGDWVWPWP